MASALASSSATPQASTPASSSATPQASTPASASANTTPEPSTSAAASSSDFFIHEFKDPSLSPIVFRRLNPSFIDTQLFTPPSLIQSTRDVTDSDDSDDDTIILEDAPPSSQDMTDVTIIIEDAPPASQDVTDSEEDITIEDTPSSPDVTGSEDMFASMK